MWIPISQCLICYHSGESGVEHCFHVHQFVLSKMEEKISQNLIITQYMLYTLPWVKTSVFLLIFKFYLQQINRLNGVPVLLLPEERHHILR